MTVLAVRVAAVEMVPLRRGWRVRWSPQSKQLRVGGYVKVAVDPYRPLRRQVIVSTAMGPLANLVVGYFCITIGLSCEEAIRMILLAVGVSNVAMGLSNLIPSYLGCASDGAVLIAWCRLKNEQSPALANVRLLALSVAGILGDELPDDDIALLSSEPMPAPLLAIGYRLNARQIQGDWRGAVRQGDKLHALLEMSSQNVDGMALLISLLKIEVGFSRAMLLRDADELRDDLLSDEVDWYFPFLRFRCLALRELIEGNDLAAEQHLDRALALALDSVDLSLSKSESRLAAHVRGLRKGSLHRSMEGHLFDRCLRWG